MSNSNYFQVTDEKNILVRSRNHFKAETRGCEYKGWVEFSERKGRLKNVSVMITETSSHQEKVVNGIMEQLQLHVDTVYPGTEYELSKSDIKIKTSG